MTESDNPNSRSGDDAHPTQPIPRMPPPLPPAPAASPRPARPAPDKGLILAGAWLACSIVVGLWLMISSHSIASDEVRLAPIPGTSTTSYGGDAYTGIQNAAANTVNGVRALARFDSVQARVERRESSRTNVGIGFIVIGIGVANFNVALMRRSTPRTSTPA
ncbi:hypothetical protein [Nocardioides sp. LS1]|uniref:hypothetical protein n=1 Tax=Nocardioides sp. LS1 TaxID=1027620 RepID=UPI000F61B88A|nr:hypothetical protein [Nocardioides sp. LS1]GCD88573.1 hypothetical protein NLS1_05790 [Nocardioides sp. LS1]